MMPRQLARSDRSRKREPRPLAENLPSINVNDLKPPKIVGQVVTAPWITFRYPFVRAVRMSAHQVEFAHSERIQRFALKAIKTNYGLPRFAFICGCSRPVITLYYQRGNLACRRCTKAIYASQACDQNNRPALQKHRIEQFIRLKPRLMRKTKQRLRARCSSNHTNIVALKRITGRALLPPVNYNTAAIALWR
jgi:hypothetical protein